MAALGETFDLAHSYAWIPDTFAALYDALQLQSSTIASAGWAYEAHDEDEALERALTSSATGEVPNSVRDYLAGAEPIAWASCSIPPADLLRRKLAVARAIDVALLSVHPRWTAKRLSAGLMSIATHYHATGQLGLRAPGFVVPRAPLSSLNRPLELPDPLPVCSGDSAAGWFRALQRFRPASDRRWSVSLGRIPARHDFDESDLAVAPKVLVAASGAPLRGSPPAAPEA